MSVVGYFAKPKPPGLERLKEIVEEVGGRTEGSVSRTEKFAEFRAEAARVRKNGEIYVEVEKYDPVLIAHCRM